MKFIVTIIYEICGEKSHYDFEIDVENNNAALDEAIEKAKKKNAVGCGWDRAEIIIKNSQKL
jgi:hypothetical protein